MNTGEVIQGTTFQQTDDDIGDRLTLDQDGSTELYRPNLVNQMEERSVASVFKVLGRDHQGSSITVNQLHALRYGEVTSKTLSINNADSAAVFDVVIESNAWELETRQGFVPQNPETFHHDKRGNLLSDGRWNYTWNTKNRLIAMETQSGLGFDRITKVTFDYDHKGRRWRKRVYEDDVQILERRFLYHDWNLIAELDAYNTVLASYTLGADISGTPQGAGGVGGLLSMKDHLSGRQFLYLYDGNGNVTGLVDADTGELVKEYEYAPFGELLIESGDSTIDNPFKFSTKYTDDETGLLYYGYRYYSPVMGRWLSRDPLGEDGGVNLYGFVGNDPINNVDLLGLFVVDQEMISQYPFVKRWIKRAKEIFLNDERMIIFAMVSAPILVEGSIWSQTHERFDYVYSSNDIKNFKREIVEEILNDGAGPRLSVHKSNLFTQNGLTKSSGNFPFFGDDNHDVTINELLMNYLKDLDWDAIEKMGIERDHWKCYPAEFWLATSTLLHEMIQVANINHFSNKSRLEADSFGNPINYGEWWERLTFGGINISRSNFRTWYSQWSPNSWF